MLLRSSANVWERLSPPPLPSPTYSLPGSTHKREFTFGGLLPSHVCTHILLIQTPHSRASRGVGTLGLPLASLGSRVLLASPHPTLQIVPHTLRTLLPALWPRVSVCALGTAALWEPGCTIPAGPQQDTLVSTARVKWPAQGCLGSTA